jgi:hypothetical protein
MTTQERNKEIALMLNWKYVSSIDIKEKKYSESIFAGWWSNIPNVYHVKVNRNLYKGRGLNDLKFHSDWNWLMETIRKILHIVSEEDNMETYNIILDQIPDIEAVFISVSDFAKKYNNKEL